MSHNLNKVEKAVLKEAGVLAWQRDVKAVKEAIILLYSPFFGQTLTANQAALIALRVKQFLDTLSVSKDMDAVVLEGIKQAHAIGMEIAAEGSEVEDLPQVPISKESVRAVEGMSERARGTIEQAKKNMDDPEAPKSFETLLGALKPVLDSPQKTQMATTWSLNNEKNQTIAEVAKKTGEDITWISERDGCVHCLRYSGEKATKKGFPKGLTFGKKPLEFKGFLGYPPLHPNCRCDIEIGISDEYADALQRESIRSILRGTKMDSESERVRLEAAKALLEKDPVAPASVKKYAKRSIKNDEFV